MLVGHEQVFVRRSVQYDRPLLAYLERKLASEAALPDARFAGHEDESGTLALARGAPQLSQPGQLALAPHQRRGRAPCEPVLGGSGKGSPGRHAPSGTRPLALCRP